MHHTPPTQRWTRAKINGLEMCVCVSVCVYNFAASVAAWLNRVTSLKPIRRPKRPK